MKAMRYQMTTVIMMEKVTVTMTIQMTIATIFMMTMTIAK